MTPCIYHSVEVPVNFEIHLATTARENAASAEGAGKITKIQNQENRNEGTIKWKTLFQ